MSNEQTSALAVIGNYAVMTAGQEIADAVSANVGGGAISPFDLDRVRVPTGGGTTFTVPSLDGDVDTKDLVGVIVHWREPRSYWRESFDATGGGTPPDCSSDDGVTGNGDPGGDCATCPLSKFGSSEKGRGQACRQSRLLFLLRENDRLPIVVVAPPSSLKGLSKFFLRLAGAGLKYHDVVVRLSLTKTKNKDGIAYAEIQAERVSSLTGPEVARVVEYAKGLAPIFAQVKVDVEDVQEAA